jgi:hypothetical protein
VLLEIGSTPCPDLISATDQPALLPVRELGRRCLLFRPISPSGYNAALRAQSANTQMTDTTSSNVEGCGALVRCSDEPEDGEKVEIDVHGLCTLPRN